jgi:hypothetical protein
MNDLIGLEYEWAQKPSDGHGKTDCFQLSCEVRDRLGMFNYAPLHDWVYQHYTEESFTNRVLVRLLLSNGRRTQDPSIGSMVLFPGERAALGTVTDCGIIYIAPGGRVVHSPVHSSAYYCFEMNQ